MDKGAEEPRQLAGRIRELVLQDGQAGRQVLDMVEDAVRLHPDSAELWCLRGDVILLADEDEGYSVDEAATSYLEANRLAPDDPEPLESLGHFYDAVMDDPREAEGFFRRALELGAGDSAREGLAEALEQLEGERD